MIYLIKQTFDTCYNLCQLLNPINFVVLCIMFFIFAWFTFANLVTRSFAVTIIKRLFITLLCSLLLENYMNIYLCISNETKENLLLVSIATVSFTAGMTFWLYKNYNEVYTNYNTTINEHILQSKYNLIKNYSNNFVKNKVLPEKYVGDISSMTPHILWDRTVYNIFKNVCENKTKLSLKEWVAFGVGLDKFSKYDQYFEDLAKILEYRDKKPEIFKAGYYYYSYPNLKPSVPDSKYYEQDLEAFVIADLLEEMDYNLKSFGGPSNFFVSRQFLGSQIFFSTESRDDFFTNFAGISYDQYVKIPNTSRYGLDLLAEKLDPTNITVISFGWIYPLFWVLEKTLGLPNPIPKALFDAQMNGTVDRFFLQNMPTAFNIKPSDLYNPYNFSDPLLVEVCEKVIPAYEHPVTKSTICFRNIFDEIKADEEIRTNK